MPPDTGSADMFHTDVLAVGLADDLWAVVSVTILWAAIGLVVARRHARRGHDGLALGAMGLLLGPLLVGFARTSLRRHERDARPVDVRRTESRPDGRHVVIGLLGPADLVADALPIVRMLHGATTIELVRPVMFDTARADDTDPHRRRAVRELQDAALFLHDHDTDLVLVPGNGAGAVRRFADERKADLLLLVGDDRFAQRHREGRHRTPTVTLEPTTPVRDTPAR